VYLWVCVGGICGFVSRVYMCVCAWVPSLLSAVCAREVAVAAGVAA